MIGEYSGTGALLRRHVPGVGMDAHIAFYEGTGTTDRRWPLSDERGSIIAITLPDGTPASINTPTSLPVTNMASRAA
ncbi:MAG: hypothetical protein ACK4E3_04320 [Brevundimonas sp.]|uniref:hypothetical protein n=1 Tax=Brevundimonas sp. TaxID=1871086 RepID=UPI003919B895